MIVTLQTERVQTLADVRAVIDGNDRLDYQFTDRDAACEFIRRTLVRFDYPTLRKPDKGVIGRYLAKKTGLSRAEVDAEPLGHPTDTTQARRIPVVFTDQVLNGLPVEYVPIAVERVAEATPLPEFEHRESAAYVFGPESGSLDETILGRCTHIVSIPGLQHPVVVDEGDRGWKC